MQAWMGEMERQMRFALRETLRFALEANAIQQFGNWLLAWPAQCILTASSIVWCRDVHAVYKVTGWPACCAHRVCHVVSHRTPCCCHHGNAQSTVNACITFSVPPYITAFHRRHANAT